MNKLRYSSTTKRGEGLLVRVSRNTRTSCTRNYLLHRSDESGARGAIDDATAFLRCHAERLAHSIRVEVSEHDAAPLADVEVVQYLHNVRMCLF